LELPDLIAQTRRGLELEILGGCEHFLTQLEQLLGNVLLRLGAWRCRALRAFAIAGCGCSVVDIQSLWWLSSGSCQTSWQAGAKVSDSAAHAAWSRHRGG
jgi:hypothetical protein